MGKTILIVEDERAQLFALSRKLEEAGFTVLQQGDGKKGLEMALKEHPDLIIADIVMPHMDGVTMIHEIRKDEEWGKGAKIILLTNLSDKEAEAVDGGVYEYIVKSDTTLDEVVSKVCACLK